MNSKLYNREFDIPETYLNYLRNFAQEKTISNLIEKKKITYSLLKKLKHRMEHGEKQQLGGDQFLGWINQVLNSNRSSIETMKDARSITSLDNQYITNHEKNDLSTINRPSKDHGNKLKEDISRINELIKIL